MAFPPESPVGRALLPGLAVTLGLFFALTRAAGSPPVFTAVFGVLGVAYLPGLAAALWVENRFGLWSSWILPLILSPLLAVGAAFLLHLSGISIDATAPWIVFLAVLAVAVAPQPQREIEDWAVSMDMPGFLRRRSDRQQVIGLATLVLVLIAAPLLARQWISTTGDAAFHLGIIHEISIRGLPPHDPLLAGVSLRTFWAFHTYLAVLEGATRVGGETLLAGGSLVAAFVLAFAGYRLLGLMALSHARSLWGAIFLFFSLNGAVWLAVPVRRLLPGGAPAGGGWLAGLDVTAGGLPPEATFFLDRFFTAGPLVMALSYLLLFVMAAVATLGENRVRWNLLAFLAALGLLLFHSGVGVIALGVTVLCIPVVWIAARLNPLRGPGKELTGTLLPIALAGLVAAPYLGLILRAGPFDPLRYVDLTPGKIVIFVTLLLPDLALGAVVLARFLGAEEVRRQAWTVWAVLLVVVCLVIGFPGPRPWLAPVVLAHVPLSLAAGASVPGWWRRSGWPGRSVLSLLLLLILVSPTALGMRAVLRAEDPRDLRPEWAEAAAWLRESTPTNAVVVDAQPDLALAARRASLYGGESHQRGLGYEGSAAVLRKLTTLSLLQGQPLIATQTRFLEGLHAPIYVIRRPARPGLQTGLPAGPSGGDEVFHNPAFVITRWTEPDSGEPGEQP